MANDSLVLMLLKHVGYEMINEMAVKVLQSIGIDPTERVRRPFPTNSTKSVKVFR